MRGGRMRRLRTIVVAITLLLTIVASEEDDEGGKGCCGGSQASLSHHAQSDPEFSVTATDMGAVPPQTVASSTPVTAELDFVSIPGGRFAMGTNVRGYPGAQYPTDGEAPMRTVTVSPFQLTRAEISNWEFAVFVNATGYVTEAEKFGVSFVFREFVPRSVLQNITQAVAGSEWWLPVKGARWDAPEGPLSNLGFHARNLSSMESPASTTAAATSVGKPMRGTYRGVDRRNHPVVHVTHTDAMEFCRWAGARLPTEAEWERAAGGGLREQPWPWGDKENEDGKPWRMNIWHGTFPSTNTRDDGYAGTAPADAFEPQNGYGLLNMVGNVWEWTADWFTSRPCASGPECLNNPEGPGAGSKRVMKGGSYLCHASYCYRYRVTARTGTTPDSSLGNVGFRCARRDRSSQT